MSSTAWVIEYKNGLHLPQVGWSLDATRPMPRGIVTHAHFDHLGNHAEVICTAATARLMRARLHRKGRVDHVLRFGQTEQLTSDCAITLHPAGHILGSALCLLQHDKLGSLLYTGDFKLRKGLVAEACETPQADVLIMETTFGRPNYLFPQLEKTREDILEFCRQNLAQGITPVLMGYSLGKSQELLACLEGSGLPIMLHPQCMEMTRIHVQLGVPFPPFEVFHPSKLAGHVVICPPLSPNSSFLGKILARSTAFASGWAIDRSTLYRQRCNAAFPLSDHADYNELLEFVDRVKPKLVYTVHGFATDFAATLRSRGIEALALGKPNQLALGL